MEQFAASEGRAVQIRIPLHPLRELGRKWNGSSSPISEKRNLKVADWKSCLRWANKSKTWLKASGHTVHTHFFYPEGSLSRKRKLSVYWASIIWQGFGWHYSRGYLIEWSPISYCPCFMDEAHGHCTLMLPAVSFPFPSKGCTTASCSLLIGNTQDSGVGHGNGVFFHSVL